MSFVVSDNNKLKNKGLIDKGPFKYKIAGDIFEPDVKIETLYQILKNKKILPHLIGEFSILFEDKEEIIIINDEIGTIKWFYYFKEEEFIVSNNLWEIANIKSLGIEDISESGIYEYLLMFQSLNQKTIFKDISLIPQGSILVYSKINHKIVIIKYTDIEYSDNNKNDDKKEIFDNIDKFLHKTISKITSFNKNCKIGVTISGGLDSRFPLPYLENISNKKEAYLIGTHKGFLEAFDYRSAKTMAKMYNIVLNFINPFSLNMKEKYIIDILRNPIGSSNIMKAINKDINIPKNQPFDVLLTGAYGGLIGGRVLSSELLNSHSEEILTNNLFYDYTELENLNKIENGYSILKFIKEALRRVTKLFFNKNIFPDKKSKETIVKDFLSSSFLIPEEEKRKVYTILSMFINREKENNKNNISIIMKLHLYRHSIRGAFESLHGQVKSYSIYHPYIYEYSKSWPTRFLEQRSIMEEFLLHKHKKLATIPLQSYELPINYKFKNISTSLKIILKLKALFNFTIRGLSISYNSWWKHKSVQVLIKKTFETDNQFFDKLFKKEDVAKVFLYKRYTLEAEQLLKLKIMFDIIEKNDYDLLLNYKLSESSKY